MSEEAADRARRLRRTGLGVPARVALEALRPLRPLIAAGVVFGAGVLPIRDSAIRRLTGDEAWDDLADAMDRDVDECPTSEG